MSKRVSLNSSSSKGKVPSVTGQASVPDAGEDRGAEAGGKGSDLNLTGNLKPTHSSPDPGSKGKSPGS